MPESEGIYENGNYETNQIYTNSLAIRDIALSPVEEDITENDQVLFLKQGSLLRKIDYKRLAKYIIEEYNKSNLAGKDQSVKDAINQLYDNSTDGDITFTMADTYQNIVSPNTLPILFGQLQKWFHDDFHRSIMSGVNTTVSLGIEDPEQYVLDASAGKVLNDAINEILTRFDYMKVIGTQTSVGTTVTPFVISKGNERDGIIIGRGENSVFFKKGTLTNGVYDGFYFKKPYKYLEIATSYWDIQGETVTQPYSSNTYFMDSNNEPVGVGVTARNVGDTDNISSEVITLGSNLTGLDKLYRLGGVNARGNAKMTTIITFIPICP